MIKIVIGMILVSFIVFFHELGHKLALGENFTGYEVKWWGIIAHGFKYKLTLGEWFYVVWNGFAFSSPVVLATYLFLGETWFWIALMISLAGSVIDFFYLCLSFFVAIKYKANLNQTLEELSPEVGLKRWKF